METHHQEVTLPLVLSSPHSLGKLIEWKPILQVVAIEELHGGYASPLVGETN
jgi:hypothetical protein